MVDQHCRWSTIALINLFSLNHLIFFLKIQPLDHACVVYLIVHHHHKKKINFLHLLPSFSSSSSSPSPYHHQHKPKKKIQTKFIIINQQRQDLANPIKFLTKITIIIVNCLKKQLSSIKPKKKNYYNYS